MNSPRLLEGGKMGTLPLSLWRQGVRRILGALLLCSGAFWRKCKMMAVRIESRKKKY